MLRIWHTYSSDNGNTWKPEESLGLAFNGVCTSPSISYGSGYILVTWLEYYKYPPPNTNLGGAYQLRIARKTNGYPWEYVSSNTYLFMDVPDGYLSEPVISSDGSQTLIILKKSDAGLVAARNSASQSGWYNWSDFIILPFTNGNSNSPALALGVHDENTATFHLVYGDGTGNIKFCQISTWGQYDIGFGGVETPSSGSGYTNNKTPTITMQNGQPQVNWIGTKTVTSGKWKGETQTSTTYRKVIKRGKSQNGTWDIFYETGDDVINTSSNSTASGDYVIAWVEEHRSGQYVNKFIKNISSNKIFYSFVTTAEYLQLSNGADLSNMYATTFNTTALPYAFEQTTSISRNLLKGGMIASGRQGVVYKENAEFYFAIGDVYLDRDLVEFEEVVDTTYINDLVHLNNYLQTEEFDINNNSTLSYSVLYGLTDSTASAEILESGDMINFNVELVDAQSGNVIGAYDDVTYTKHSLDNYNNISHTINTEGAGNREVRLRLVVNDNLNGGYGFSKIFGEETVLGKFSNPVEQNYQGSMEVKQFALTQNYPNLRLKNC